MRNFSDSLSKVKKTVDLINLVWIFCVILEVIIVIAIGICSNKFSIFSFTSKACLCLILLTVFYLFLKFFFIKFNNQISKDSVEEIESKYNLEIVNKSYARISIINDTIAKSLYHLNEKTCNIIERHVEYPEDNENHLCDNNIKEGFEKLLLPFSQNITTILECNNNSKISVGLYLNPIYYIDSNNELKTTESIFFVKDDNNFSNHLPMNLESYEKEINLTIQNILKESIVNNKFYKTTLEFDSKKYSIVSSIIPCVCSDNIPYGLFFIISDCTDKCPNDLEAILNIFNRITSNWNARYIDCVMAKLIKLQNEKKN